jgi:TRAP-type C4-dicarboxylate transport system permease small subunit
LTVRPERGAVAPGGSPPRPPPLVDRISSAVGNGLSWLFLVAVALTVYEVVLRYAFNAPTIWVHDMVIVLTAVCFVFGGPLASQRRSHIQVASFADRARPGVRKALGVLCQVLTAVYLALLLYAAVKQAIPSLEVMETSGRAWDVPMPAFLKTVLVVGVALMLVQELSHLRHRTPPKDDAAKENSETIL